MKSDIMSIAMGELTATFDNEVMKAVRKVGIDVNKEELLKALELHHSLVRCEECIHCADDWNGNQPMFTCELGRCGESVQPNDFCSYGERKEQ